MHVSYSVVFHKGVHWKLTVQKAKDTGIAFFWIVSKYRPNRDVQAREPD